MGVDFLGTALSLIAMDRAGRLCRVPGARVLAPNCRSVSASRGRSAAPITIGGSMPPACVQIPIGDKIPPTAKIFSYPVAEAWGLIWAFNGEMPLFAVPHPGDRTARPRLAVRLRGIGEVLPWVSTSNGVDFQHLRLSLRTSRSQYNALPHGRAGCFGSPPRPLFKLCQRVTARRATLGVTGLSPSRSPLPFPPR